MKLSDDNLNNKDIDNHKLQIKVYVIIYYIYIIHFIDINLNNK